MNNTKYYNLDISKIRELALRKGMSLSMLCTEAGMSRSCATEWKSRPVTPRTVYRIANILETDPIELIVQEDRPCRD